MELSILSPGKVEVQSIDYPKLQNAQERGNRSAENAPHGVILKIVTTNICGQRSAYGPRPDHRPIGTDAGPRDHRRSSRKGQRRRDVLNVGDLVTVPFNIACGRCRNCREGKTGICLTVNPARPGARLRLRGYGRLGGRPGRIRFGPLRGFQPHQVSRIKRRPCRRSRI